MRPSPPHDRKLGLIGVALTLQREPKNNHLVMNLVRDEIESILINSNFFDDTPFSWITIALRYGLQDEKEPEFGRINKKYGDLPISIEIDVSERASMSELELHNFYSGAVLRSLILVASRYNLPTEPLNSRLREIECSA